MWIGNFKEDATLRFRFNTHDGVGNLATLVSGAVSVYKDGDVAQFTTGVTLTTDFDGITGLHQVEIVMTDAAYTGSSDYTAYLSAGTVAGQSVAGTKLIDWSIDNRFPVSSQLLSAAQLGIVVQENVNVVTGGAAQVTATDVSDELTFFLGTEGHVARNIITLNAWATGTRTLAFDISEVLGQSQTTINTVTSVTVIKQGGTPTITTSELRKHQGQTKALWEVAAITTADAGTYEVTLTFVTFDANTWVVTGELRVE